MGVRRYPRSLVVEVPDDGPPPALDEVKYSRNFPLSKYISFAQLNEAFNKEIELANLGKKTVREALTDATAAINGLIKENIASREAKNRK